MQVCWAGPHTLATVTDKDNTIRLLQLETDDNYVLDVSKVDFNRQDSGKDTKDASTDTPGVAAIAYEPQQQVFAAATVGGRLCTFRRLHNAQDDSGAEPVKQWEPQQAFQVSVGIRTCTQ